MTVRRNHTTTVVVAASDIIRQGRMKKDAGDIRFYQDPGRKLLVPHDTVQTNDPDTLQFDLNVTVPASDYHPGLQGYFPLDGDTLNTFGVFGDGVPTALTYVNGQIGRAGLFDGADTVVTIPALGANSWFNQPLYSMECWVNPLSAGENALGRIFDIRDNAGLNGPLLRVANLAGGLLELEAVWVSWTTTNPQAVTPAVVPIGEWTHIGLTWSFTTNRFQIYVNGSLVALATDTAGVGTAGDDSANSLLLGNDPASVRTFDGAMCGFAFYPGTLLGADEFYSSYVKGLNKKRLRDPRPTWRLSMDAVDNAGSILDASDSVGTSDGVISGGVTVGQGRVSGALTFNGVDGQVQVAIPSAKKSWVGANGSFTLFTTFRHNTPSGGQGTIFGSFDSTPSLREFAIRVHDFPPYLSLELVDGPSLATVRVGTTNPLPKNIDFHLAVTFDNSQPAVVDKVNIYIDGVLQAKVQDLFDPFTSIKDALPNQYIGNLASNIPAQYLNGTIMELGITSDVLSAPDIADLAQRSIAGNSANLNAPYLANTISYWSLDPKARVIDNVGGHNGTLVGTVTTGQPARHGQGLLFDAVTGLVTIPDSAKFTAHHGLTGTSTWVATVQPGSGDVIGINENTGAGSAEFEFIVSSGAPVEVRLYDQGSSASYISYTSLMDVPGNISVQIAVVYDRRLVLSDRVRIYIDGVEVPTTNATVGSFSHMTETSKQVVLGASASPPVGSTFGGVIEELLWSPKALTPIAVKSLADRSIRGLSPDFEDPELSGLLAYWSMNDEDFGTYPQDKAGTVLVSPVNNVDDDIVFDVDGPFGVGNATRFTRPATVSIQASAQPRLENLSPGSVLNPGAGSATVCAWVRTTDTGFQHAVARLAASEPQGTLDAVMLSVRDTSKSGWIFWRDAAGTLVEVDGSTYVMDGEWHFIVGVLDRTKAKAFMYVDGVLEGSSDASVLGNVVFLPDTRLSVGNYYFNSVINRRFGGDIGDVSYYPEALSARDIRDLYEKTRAGFDHAAEAQRIFPVIGDIAKNDASDPVSVWVNPSVPNVLSSNDFSSEDLSSSVADIGGSFDLAGDVRVGSTGDVGKALSLRGGKADFDGTLLPTGDMSILFKFKTTETDCTILADYDGDSAALSGSSLTIVSGILKWTHKESGVVLSSLAAVNDGQWHSVLVTVSNGGNADLYVDSDTADATAAIVNTIAPPSTARIGGYTPAPYVAPAGEVFRVESDLGVSVTDGRVTSWEDQSVSARNLSQSTVSRQPLFFAEHGDGLPAVSFSDTMTLFMTKLDLTNSDFTMFAVITPNKDFNTTQGGRLIDAVSGLGQKGVVAFGPLSGNTTDETISFLSNDNPGNSYVAAKTVTPTFTGGQPILATFGLAGSSADIRIDGSDLGALTAGVGTGPDSGAGRSIAFDRIGNNDAGTTPLNGKLQALLVFNSRLSVADTDYVERYLAIKYGIQIPPIVGSVRADVEVDSCKVWGRKLSAGEVTDILGSPSRYLEPRGTVHKIRDRIDPDTVTYIPKLQPSAQSGGFTQLGGFAAASLVSGTVEFASPLTSPVNYTSTGTLYDSVISVYDSQDKLRWIASIRAGEHVSTTGIHRTPDGGFLVMGAFNGATITAYDPAGNAGPSFNKSAGSLAIRTPFWAKFDANGNPLYITGTTTAGTLSGTSRTRVVGSSLNTTGDTAYLIGHTQFESTDSDLDFGNGVLLPNRPKAASGTAEVTWIAKVRVSDGVAQTLMSNEIVQAGNLTQYQSSVDSGAVSNVSPDGKLSLIAFHGTNSPSVPTIGNLTSNPISTRIFGNTGTTADAGWAPFVAQISETTLAPDWVVTAGQSAAPPNITSGAMMTEGIARDDAGNTYFIIQTDTSALDTLDRDPTPYASPVALDADTAHLVKLDANGDVVWIKKISGVGGVANTWFRASVDLSGPNVVVWAKVTAPTTMTYAVGDPEQTVLSPSSVEVHVSLWDQSTGTFVGVDRHTPNVDSQMITAPRVDHWTNGQFIGTGWCQLVSNTVLGGTVGNLTITSDFANQGYKGYVARYDGTSMANLGERAFARALNPGDFVIPIDISVLV